MQRSARIWTATIAVDQSDVNRPTLPFSSFYQLVQTRTCLGRNENLPLSASFSARQTSISKTLNNCVRRRKNALLMQIGVEIVWDNKGMDLGTRIWHLPQILQGRMTSSPTWKGGRARDRDHRTYSPIFDYYWY